MPITESLRSKREGKIEDIDWDAIGEFLEKRLLPKLQALIRSRFGPDAVFGVDNLDDLASEAKLWLIERMRSPDDLPEKIINRRKLLFYLCDSACDRYRYQLRKQKGGKSKQGARRGGSALGRDADGNLRTFDTLCAEDGPGPLVMEEPLEEIKALDLALGDLKAWADDDGKTVQLFLDRIQTDASQKSLAKTHGMSDSAVSKALKRCEFVLKRRLGYSPQHLAKSFLDAERWDREIINATGSPASH